MFDDTFYFQGKEYEYFKHKYNTTWKNERAVEIPVIWDTVCKYTGKKILGIGNVLSHYFPVNYKVVDKYEKAEGVISKDIVEYNPDEKYDLIESISTLEHVGWDEEPKDPHKIRRAIEKIKNLLAPSGVFIATVPLGYNPHMDRFLWENPETFTQILSMKRISEDNRWIEVDYKELMGSKYGYPFPWGNGLIIAYKKLD